MDDYELEASSYAYEEVANEHVKFAFENLYPGVYFEVNFKFEIGTIPVILTSTPYNSMIWFNQKINGVYGNWIDALIESGDIKIEIIDETGAIVWPNYDNIIQLHPGIEYEWILTIHIPQDNGYMNCYAEAELSMDIIQWSDPCSKVLKLPGEMNVKLIHPGDDSYWDVKINSIIGTGPWSPPIAVDAVINGWCVDGDTQVGPGNYDVIVHYDGSNGHISRELLWPGNPSNTPNGIGPWDCIDYIINHKGSNNQNDVQDAIWYYVNGGNYPSDPDAQVIIDDVNANAVDWIHNGHPISGELAAVLLDPGIGGEHNKQYIIIEVDP